MYDWLVAKQLRAFYMRVAAMQPDEGRFLDIGCGPGYLAAALEECHPRAYVIGMDLDPAQIERAKRNAPEVDFQVGDSRDLPFDDDHFDRVLTTESFHHWVGQDKALQEIHRTLKPGGECWIVEGAGDMTRMELAGWTERKPLPGMLALARMVFRTHGYTTDALHEHVLPVIEDSPFGGCSVERIDGWWILKLKRP